jgi:hypothetical protein
MSDDDSFRITRLRSDEPVMTPEHYLWLAMMDMALSRVQWVLKFASEWTDIRFAMDYELKRTRCLFHLSWLFDDAESSRFTFRTLCQFSNADDLRDVKVARKRILEAFSKECLQSLAKPVDDGMLKRVATAWVGYGPGIKTQCRSRTPVRDVQEEWQDGSED